MSGTAGITRRGLIAAGVGAGALAALAAAPVGAFAGARKYPFTLGIASGAPTSNGVVLWTRLAPAPLEAGGGMAPRSVPVQWQVATDERFSQVVRFGSVMAHPEDAHAVHVDVTGLAPDRWYYYRFRGDGAVSPVGRTRTLPLPGSDMASLRIAVASCQRYEEGYYTAYRHMATHEVDLVVHLGDYIYEDVLDSGRRLHEIPVPLRDEAKDLLSYRRRHALYRLDPDLQTAHASAPWVLIPDNHDAVDDGDHTLAIMARKAAAYRAYYEHLPLEPDTRPRGPMMRIHRSLDFGSTLRLHLLDTRQYRSDQHVCGTALIGPRCAALDDPNRSMLGAEQEKWLATSLQHSDATWNAIAQTVLFAPYDFTRGDDRGIYYASWDGYPAARRRLLADIAEHRPRNPVMLSADWHTAWVNDVPGDPDDLDSPRVMTEFLTTGVSSTSSFTSQLTTPSMDENPQVRFYDESCGYTLCTIGPDRWHTEFFSADTTDPDRGVHPVATWTIEAGSPTAHTV
jgi:alkaline phosphatase D